MEFCTWYPSPVGRMKLASDGEALTGLWFDGQKHFPARTMEPKDALPLFGAVRDWLDGYFAGQEPDPAALPLAPAGSNFQKLVWSLLLDIPYGEAVTYGALALKAAARMGRYTMSAQAVGGAVGRNPISVIIPCHRVIGADGSLTGYAAGLGVKSWLLQHEGAL